jgi:hypothetical protein
VSGDLGVSDIWRTDGNSWTQVLTDLADDTVALGVFSDSIYAAGANTVWRSATGDLNDWQAAAAISGTQPTMEAYGDHLYAGFCNSAWGAGLWRTDGVSWTAVFTSGLGTPRNACLPSMAEFQDNLYIGLWNFETGAQVWRSGDGLDWTPVFTGGLGNRLNRYPNGLIVFADELYLAFRNGESGAGVWRSSDGETWEQVNAGGWGDPKNGNADFWDKGAAVFGKSLYLGTWKDGGGEVWQLSLAYPVYLPLVASGHTP